MADPVVPSQKPVKRRADQDQKIADQITADGQYLETVKTDPEILATLAGRGYDTATLDDGLTLQRAAQAAFTLRQTMLAAQSHATAGLSGSTATVREMYIDFRDTVRAITDFTASDRTALKVTGVVSPDKQKMITAARASYQAAQAEPYASILATYGYPATAITNALAALDAYATADTDQNSAIGSATKATADRNAAVKALDVYMKQLRGIAKVALRKRPDLLKKLNE
jgi:hypothetical protein